MVSILYKEAQEVDQSIEKPKPSPLQHGAMPVQMMMRKMLTSQLMAGATEALFVGSLKQVLAYLNDSETRNEIKHRVAQAIQADTRVSIGHSLGSVIAYEILAAGTAPQVNLLISVESPLGIPNIVFERLDPKPVDGMGA